jgi:hypothetical protein
MAMYMVSTVSTFSNKYFVEAESRSQAIEFALDNDSSEYWQLHLGENAALVEVVDEVIALAEIKAQGYF